MNNPFVKKKPGFPKGISPNPKGRPKGCISKSTAHFLKLKSLAANDYEKAYKLLWEEIENRSSWAFQLYFKDLVPKKLNQETVIIDLGNGALEDQINALRTGLSRFTEHTEESLLNTLKVLSNIKANESLNDQTQIIKESREELLEKVNKISNVIEFIKQNESSEDKIESK